ncbi:hypothetical protein [Nocardioides psychrotolerans]|uniref:hypothetical protein n=1 Tax=Nocardioides psychrotolerans TaxID=1005945 RepID=UPI0031383378
MPTVAREALLQRLAHVDLHYRCSKALLDDHPAVQQWWVLAIEQDSNIVDDAGNPVEREIARISLVRESLWRASLWDELDELEGDLETVASAILNRKRGDLAEELLDRLEGAGSSVLILNSATLAAEWRGHGVGRLLAGVALLALSDGVSCFATYPAPLDGSTGAERDRAILELGQVWARLGFQPFRDGVWVLDPALVTLDNAVTALKSDLGVAG